MDFTASYPCSPNFHGPLLPTACSNCVLAPPMSSYLPQDLSTVSFWDILTTFRCFSVYSFQCSIIYPFYLAWRIRSSREMLLSELDSPFNEGSCSTSENSVLHYNYVVINCTYESNRLSYRSYSNLLSFIHNCSSTTCDLHLHTRTYPLTVVTHASHIRRSLHTLLHIHICNYMYICFAVKRSWTSLTYDDYV